jgi:hypothetical protein
MSYLLGVINTSTNKYENIYFVDKKNKYKCISCNSDLILRKGEKNFQSFIHKYKCKGDTVCQYFKQPTQEQLINDAKLFLRELLYQNNFTVYRRCKICKFKFKMELPINNETNSIAISNENNFIYVYDENENKICEFKLLSDLDDSLKSQCYYIIMKTLIHTIVCDFATKKVELTCKYEDHVCKDCHKYLNLCKIE